MRNAVIFGIATFVLIAGGARAQSQNRSSENPLAGSVTEGTATAEELPLSLEDAIRRGLKNNLAGLLDSQDRRSAEAARLRTLASLLPNVSASLSDTSQQVNLAAFGFSLSPRQAGPMAAGHRRLIFKRPYGPGGG